jgi:hypothetical protein
MVNTYVLVNPHIEGQLKTKVKAQNSKEAAQKLYQTMSEHFNSSLPKFYFSIQKGSSGHGSLYHFEVEESREADEVSFQIKSMSIKGSAEAESKFIKRLEDAKHKIGQEGGKKHKKDKKKDSDSDSDFDSSSSEDYKRAKSYIPVNQPIYYWWYDPYVYRLDSIYVPTFYTYTAPRIELSLLLLP